MKTAAIIAEYNPFHAGHAYQISQIRDTLHADRIIVIMSGNFVQRGIPAIFDKYTRTKMALAGGADMVIELPVRYALGSAEFFARGAVSILNSLGSIDYLHFGSECGNIDPLKAIASVLLNEPVDFQQILQKYLKSGMTFPQARAKAFQDYVASDPNVVLPEADYTALLSSPNNILGIEYIKALLKTQSTIQPVTLERTGAGYHEESVQESILPSASGLRSLFDKDADFSLMKPHMPIEVWNAMYEQHPTAIHADDFSTMLHYKLLTTSHEEFMEIQDITSDLADRIMNRLPEYVSFTQFAYLLKTKELTYSRICRCLFHILLDLKKEFYQMDSTSLYCRILGFRKDSADLFKILKQTSSIPMISKLADAAQLLSSSALTSLESDLHAADLYRAALVSRTHSLVKNEYRQEIIRF